jgi:molybdopterin converting factor small subunit
MKVTVEYAAQVKQAAGVGTETVELDDGCSVQELVSRVAELHGDPLRRVILDADGKLHPSILLFVGDDQVRADSPVKLHESDVVTLLSPVSGG